MSLQATAYTPPSAAYRTTPNASSLCLDRAFKHRRHLIGVYLINVYLTGVHLMTVHLTGLHLIGVCLLAASDAKKIAMCPQGEGGFGNNCS
jgi:hypothetical protein